MEVTAALVRNIVMEHAQSGGIIQVISGAPFTNVI